MANRLSGNSVRGQAKPKPNVPEYSRALLLAVRLVRLLAGLLLLGAIGAGSLAQSIALAVLLLASFWAAARVKRSIASYQAKEEAMLAERRYWERAAAEAETRERERNAHTVRLQQKLDIQGVVQGHRRALMARRRQLLISDPYGVLDRSKWDAELTYFIERVLSQEIEVSQLDPALGSRLPAFIEAQLESLERIAIDQPPEALLNVDSMSGIEFERYCAETLSQAGWSTRVTSASHDQGVDILAECGSITLVIQCKRYNRPVGNKAVQEVFAAKAHSLATHAAVVSNAGFTSTAVELARTCEVLLLHFSDLTRLGEILVPYAP